MNPVPRHRYLLHAVGFRGRMLCLALLCYVCVTVLFTATFFNFWLFG